MCAWLFFDYWFCSVKCSVVIWKLHKFVECFMLLLLVFFFFNSESFTNEILWDEKVTTHISCYYNIYPDNRHYVHHEVVKLVIGEFLHVRAIFILYILYSTVTWISETKRSGLVIDIC